MRSLVRGNDYIVTVYGRERMLQFQPTTIAPNRGTNSQRSEIVYIKSGLFTKSEFSKYGKIICFFFSLVAFAGTRENSNSGFHSIFLCVCCRSKMTLLKAQ